MIGRLLIALLVFLSPNALRAEDMDDAPKKTIQFPSPDGKFAFRYVKSCDRHREMLFFRVLDFVVGAGSEDGESDV